jgi:NTE family protein
LVEGNPGWSIADIVRHLASTSVFRRLDEAMLTSIARTADVVLVPAGDSVLSEGAEGNEAFVVIAGRLDVIIATPEGASETVGTLGPGDVVGEMALITNEPRSATVTARRDSALMRIPAGEFRTLVFAHPDVLLDVTRTVMGRLNRSIHGERPDSATNVVAVVPAGSSPLHREFAEGFLRAAGDARIAVVTATEAHDRLGDEPSRARVAEYLHRLEDENDLLVLIGDPSDIEWTRLCRRQCDVMLSVGGVEGLARYAPYEEQASGEWAEAGASHHLVLVHPVGAQPTGTEAILGLRLPARHHHIREGSRDDVERVTRIVLDRSVGVVFGGGGARGFAHLGVIKAMRDVGIPIDHVGGASMGASIGASFAMGWEWDRIVEIVRHVTFERGKLVDTTLPLVSAGRGRRLTSGMRGAYGDTDIRDLWTDFYCVSTDLTDGVVYEHTDGAVWPAVRASVSIPGVFPPMASPEGHVLVDGGVLDNVPTATMRRIFDPRTIIAIDLRAPSSLPIADLPPNGDLSGWVVAWQRLVPGRDRMEVPRLLETLIASSTVSGQPGAGDADLVLRPDVGRFGIMDFTAWDTIIEVGYEAAKESLVDFAENS